MSLMQSDLSNASKQSLLLRNIPREDGSVDLRIASVGEDLLAFLKTRGVENPIDCSLADLCGDDYQCLEDWIEFIVKLPQQDAYGITADEYANSSRTILQFVRAVKQWVVTTITCINSCEVVRLDFRSLQSCQELPEVERWQLKDLRMNKWLVDHMVTGGSWEVHTQSQSIYLSRPMARLLHFAEDAVVLPLNHFIERIHPEDRRSFSRSLNRVAEDLHAVFCRFLLDDGQVIYMKSFAVASFDEQGEMDYVLGRSHNYTESWNQKMALKLSEQRFHSIIENASDLIFVLDSRGIYTYISPSSASVLGQIPEAFIGKPFGLYMDRDQVMMTELLKIEKFIERHASGQSICRVCAADGALKWLQLRICTVPTSDGRDYESIVIVRDISNEKADEEQLRFLSDHDELTQLYNREFFWRAMTRLREQKESGVCLALLDMNGLSIVNEVLGYDQGDAALVEAAGIIKCSFDQPNALIARIGGDEFAVLVAQATLKEMEEACSRVMAACNETKRRMFPLSISYGIARRNDGNTNNQLLYKLADSRLHNHKLLEKRSLQGHIILSLKEALKARNLETSEHMQRMEQMVLALGKRLLLSTSELDRLVLLASLHDVGKVGIPDRVINKPGRLNEAEWLTMCTHCEVGQRIAMVSQDLAGISQEIRSHHEHWDGSGYPDGLGGEEIPLLSQLISVVDAYDVMTHKRIYKDAISHEEALQELRRCSGSQFDPDVVNIFLEAFGSHWETEIRSLGSQ